VEGSAESKVNPAARVFNSRFGQTRTQFSHRAIFGYEPRPPLFSLERVQSIRVAVFVDDSGLCDSFAKVLELLPGSPLLKSRRAAAAREGGCARGCKSHPSNSTVHDGTARCLSLRKAARGVSSPGKEPMGLKEDKPQLMSRVTRTTSLGVQDDVRMVILDGNQEKKMKT
jgi:hypothetical protein